MNNLDVQAYSYIGDVISLLLAGLCYIMIRSTYATEKTRNFRVYQIYFCLVFIGASTSIAYHRILDELTAETVWLVYALHFIYVFSLILALIFIGIYLSNVVSMARSKQRILYLILVIVFCVFIIEEVVLEITGIGFHITSDLQAEKPFLDAFWLNYAILITTFFISLLINRKRIVTHIQRGLIGGFSLSFIIVLAELIFRVDSFTTFSYVIPLFLGLYFFHFNTFDIKSGCLNSAAFNGYIRSIYGKKFHMIFLYLQGMNMDRQASLSDVFYHFNEKFYKSPYIFQIRDDHFALVSLEKSSENFEEATRNMLHEFGLLYRKYQIDYKIMIMHTNDEIDSATDYFRMVENIEKGMKLNTIYHCVEQDFATYKRQEYILSELNDIARKHDLNDPRVLVYCQPVFHTTTQKFSTAEALMRLNLNRIGLTFPDQFIHIAEDNNLIHILSMIILNKTCKAIHDFLESGYYINRISVNISMMELQDDDFCTEVLHIIRSNGIPYSKIAIEITESKNEKEFKNVQTIMSRLSRVGMKFYLDDFGTDYSNLERITVLPFDIVKFDRSLTIMSGMNESNYKLVRGLAHILAEAEYHILYEGVETQEDVQRCIEMDGQYLQGYHYSKPIPISQIDKFLSREVDE